MIALPWETIAAAAADAAMGVPYKCPAAIKVSEFQPGARQISHPAATIKCNFENSAGPPLDRFCVVRGRRYVLTLPRGPYSLLEFQFVGPTTFPYANASIRELQYMIGNDFQPLKLPFQRAVFENTDQHNFILRFEDDILSPFPARDYTLYVFANAVNIAAALDENVLFRTNFLSSQ